MDISSYFLKENSPRWHVWVAALVTLFIGIFLSPYVSSIISRDEAQVNRVAVLKLEDYRKIADETQKFNVMLQTFTLDIQHNRVVPEVRRNEMIASLLMQYDSIKQFRVYIEDASLDAPMTEYQSSLVELRGKVLATKYREDLDAFYVTLADTLKKQKAILSVLEKTAGKKST